MLHVWKRSPLLRIFNPCCIGVALQFGFGWPWQWILLLFLLLSVIMGSMLFLIKKHHYRRRWYKGFLFTIISLTAGMLLVHAHDERAKSDHYIHHHQAGDLLKVKLTDVPDAREKSYRVIADVEEVISDSLMKSVCGRLLIYLGMDSSVKTLRAGDELVIAGVPELPAGPLNPGVFDHRAYLEHHGILRQIYLRPGGWQVVGHRDSFRSRLISIRENMLKALSDEQVSGREYAVLAALVLGKTTEIDTGLMNAYAEAGAVHVLAVSGLHVALVYMILAPVLNRLFRQKKFRWLKTIIPVTLLWLYAGITGFSPSVLRAALMFTCFIIADNFQKQNNIYNTMSASALILLMDDPAILFEVGFQLSYLAVLGIVVLQKHITGLFYSRIRIIQWAWKLTAVSLAAQISTLPVTLYYFHQFPTWFILTNLIVIPLSTVILYVSLAFFALCWWGGVAHFLAGFSGFLTRIMNDIMIWSGELPKSVITGFDLTITEMALLYLLQITACYWFFWTRPKALPAMMICICLLLVIQIVETYHTLRQQEVCFHSARGHDAISLISGDQLVWITDSAAAGDERFIKYHGDAYHNSKGITGINHWRFDLKHKQEKGCFRYSYPMAQSAEMIICMVEPETIHMVNRCEADVFYFTSAWNEMKYLSFDTLDLSGQWVVLSSGIKPYRKKQIRQKLPPDAIVRDLDEGAQIYRDHSLWHFTVATE